MSDPWQTLILDRSTASERDVKAAYARLLKLHRPDVDPEGFQRVRSAYSEALGWLKQQTRMAAMQDETAAPADANESAEPRLAEALDPPAQASPSAAELPPEEAPPELEGILASLAEAWREGSRAGMVAAFARLSTESIRLQLPAQKVCRLLHQAVGGKAEPVAKHAPADLLLYLLNGGEAHVLIEVTKAWDSSHSIPSAAMLAMAMERTNYKPADEDAAMVLAHLARILAFNHHGLANQLATAAYPLLPRDGRDQIMGFLEHQIVMGKLFFGFPAEIMRFWQKRLNEQRNDADTTDWGSNEALEAMRYVVQNRGHSWDGLGVIHQLVPADIWARAETSLHAQANKSPSSRQTAGKGGKSSFRWGWLLIVLAVNLPKMFNSESGSASHSTRPASSYSPQSISLPALTSHQPLAWPSPMNKSGSVGLNQPSLIVPTMQVPTLEQQAVPVIRSTIPTLQPSLRLTPSSAPSPLVIPRN